MGFRELAKDGAVIISVLSVAVLAVQACAFPMVYLDGIAKARWAKESMGIELKWYEAYRLDIYDIKEMKKTNPEE